MPNPGTPGGSILVVAGTHGNERNAIWLQQQWLSCPERLAAQGFVLEHVLGNPEAARLNRRYIDRDLNRCFEPARLADASQQQLEVSQARALLQRHGEQGERPALVVFDLHSTTAAMGNSLVVYGRRPADLALAAALQQRLGLPVYLHEADAAQTGFLVERWPCGLVIEVGPVPQGVVDHAICRQTQLALEVGLEVLAEAAVGALRLPPQLQVHRHLASVDLPRDLAGAPAALLHPWLQGRDWQPVRPQDPVFIDSAQHSIALEAVLPLTVPVWPVFVGEASYGEKGIAFSLTNKESWPSSDDWSAALSSLSSRLQRGEPL